MLGVSQGGEGADTAGVMSWRAAGNGCDGCMSTRNTSLTPRRTENAGRSVPRALTAARLPLHVRSDVDEGCPFCSLMPIASTVPSSTSTTAM